MRHRGGSTPYERLMQELELLELLGADEARDFPRPSIHASRDVIELRPTCPTGCPVGKTATVDGVVVCPRCGKGIVYK